MAEAEEEVEDTILPLLASLAPVLIEELQESHSHIGKHLPGGLTDGQILAPAEATAYLDAMRTSILNAADDLVQTYSPIRWLWYTRRLFPDILGGHLSTTGTADHALMESLSALSRRRDDTDRLLLNGRAVYPNDADAVRPLAQLAALAKTLGKVHAWLRRAGKLTSFTVYADRFPEPVEDLDLEAAIDDFDHRVAAWPAPAWMQGLEPVSAAVDVDDWLMLTVMRVPDPTMLVPGWSGVLGGGEPHLMTGQFFILPMSLTALRRTLAASGDNRQWWPDTLPDVVALLQIVMAAAHTTSQTIGMSVPAYGYTTWTTQALREQIDAVLPVISPDLRRLFPHFATTSAAQLLAAVATVDAEYWPWRPGPILRSVGETTIIDIYTASQRLHSMATMPRGLSGQLTNVISTGFEHFIQDGIDHSHWAPTADLRAYRGKQLTRDQTTITDIDAIGRRGNQLLLVSCKNFPYTAEYDSGELRVVRNIEDRLDSAVREWRKHVNELQANPRGDNYDLSGFQLHGVVVTPLVLFSRDPDTTAALPIAPLRAASGAGELFTAVNATDAWRRPAPENPTA